MPPVLLIGAVAGAALSAGFAAAAGTVIFGLSVALSAGVIFGISLVGTLALGLLQQALAGKPKEASQLSPAGEAQARTQMVRSAIMSRRIVIGRAVVSGPMVFAATHPEPPTSGAGREGGEVDHPEGGGTGNVGDAGGDGGATSDVPPPTGSPAPGAENAHLTLVIALAAHEVFWIGEVFFNDTPATDPRFAGRYNIRRYYGAVNQVADQRLISANVGWTGAHRLQGIAYLVVELVWDAEVFATGIPNIKAEVWGLQCYDPRDGSTSFTHNVALVTRAYLANQDWGLHAAQSEIDDAGSFIAAANTCDEYVDLVGEVRAFSVLAPLPNSVLYLYEPRLAIGIGDRVRLVPNPGATLPAPFQPDTDYYAIPTETRSAGNVSWSNGIMLAPSLWHARHRLAVLMTMAGSGPGTCSIVRTAQLRYTANGVIDCGKTPKAIIDDIMSADTGICVWEAGLYRHFAGGARASSFVLTQSDLRAPISVTPTIDKQRLCNQVFGTYVNPVDSWQPADFPGVTNSLYLAEDLGEPIRRDVELGYTTDPVTAQRIAKIYLEATRQGAQLTFPAKTIGLGISIWDVGQIYIPMLGYDGKLFQCIGWRFSDDAGFDLDLREYTDVIYAWNYGNATLYDPAPDTMLPKPWITAPTAITGFHEELVETRGGAGVAAALTVYWAAANDAFVVGYDLQYRQLQESDWRPLPRVSGLQTTIVDIPANTYEFRVRAVNSLGVTSPWSAIASYEVVGLTAQPADITGFMLQPRGRQGHLRWDLHPDLDVRIGGRIRLRWSPDTLDAVWENTVPLLPGDPTGVAGGASEATVPLLIGTYFAKAVDSSGNICVNAARVINLTPADFFDSPSVDTLIFEPAWSNGTFVNTAAPDGALTLVGNSLVDDYGMIDELAFWDVGDTGVVPSGYWVYNPIIDFGAVYAITLTALLQAQIINVTDMMDSRIANIDDWDNFDGVAVGAHANAYIEVQATNDDPAGASPAWGPWTPFLAMDIKARALQFLVSLDTSDPQYSAFVTAAHVTMDMPDRTESGTTVSSASGDTTVLFRHRFFSTPRIGGQVQMAAFDDQFVLVLKNATGFVFRIINAAGALQVRTVDWQAAGQGYGGF